jgi:hypothetical protein
MTCQDCELFLVEGETSATVEEHLRGCAGCRALREDLRANALVLESLGSEELPTIAVRIPRRRRPYSWIATAGIAATAAAAFALSFFTPRNPPPVRPSVSQLVNEPAPPPLKIKMLTSDPNVVIYWLIEN